MSAVVGRLGAYKLRAPDARSSPKALPIGGAADARNTQNARLLTFATAIINTHTQRERVRGEWFASRLYTLYTIYDTLLNYSHAPPNYLNGILRLAWLGTTRFVGVCALIDWGALIKTAAGLINTARPQN